MSSFNKLLAGVLVEGFRGSGCGPFLVVLIIFGLFIKYVIIFPTERALEWAVEKYEEPVRFQEKKVVHKWAKGAYQEAYEYHDSLFVRSLRAHEDESLYYLYQDSLQAAWARVDSIGDLFHNPPTPRADNIHRWIIAGVIVCWVIIISIPVCLVWMISKRKKRNLHPDGE